VLAAVMEGIKERIAADPYASRFALTGPLRRYGLLKGQGLPDRYRLVFRPFEAQWGSPSPYPRLLGLTQRRSRRPDPGMRQQRHAGGHAVSQR